MNQHDTPDSAKLPTKTPQSSRLDVASVTIKFSDGSTKFIIAPEGQGTYTESRFTGQKKSFTTQEVFIADGLIRDTSAQVKIGFPE